jgi:hypothetical protein
MADSMKHEQSGISGRVTHSMHAGPVAHAEVRLYRAETSDAQMQETDLDRTQTDAAGYFHFSGRHGDGTFLVRCQAFGTRDEQLVNVAGGCAPEVLLDLKEVGFEIGLHAYEQGERLVPAIRAVAGRRVVVRAAWPDKTAIGEVRWDTPRGAAVVELEPAVLELLFARSGKARVQALGVDLKPNSFGNHAEAGASVDIVVSEPELQMIAGNLGVTLHRTASDPTLDQALWVAIRNRTNAISFGRYREFLNRVLRWEENDRLPGQIERRLRDLGTHLRGVGAYQVLKTATEMFLLLECGVRIERGSPRHPDFDPLEEESRLGEPVSAGQIADRLQHYLGRAHQLPYITRVVEAAFPELERVALRSDGILATRINEPCLLELIWCYWHEEGMLMQTINAVSQRFQNFRRAGDPLVNLEIDPLRPVNNLLWGFVQDEVHRLSVSRRACEYLSEYGVPIYGRAAAACMPAETRSKFLEAFHNLLYQSSKFFKEDFQTTVIADGFPLLNALQEVHLILAQGAHNQFGDLPWTARSEMMLAEYILARPEIRDFLQSRMMIPYKEAWMPQVDTMKSLQGWTDVTVTHFRDLGVYGEQLLLSVRYGDWINVNDENAAKNWARYWRPEIQGYMHAYRAATGIDLTNSDKVDATVPALLLQRRLSTQQRARERKTAQALVPAASTLMSTQDN